MKLIDVVRWLWHKKWYMLITGALFVGILFCVQAYKAHYSYALQISFIYPKAEKGQYPDGARFLMYDFLDQDCVAEALSSMQDRGYYKDITVNDLRKNLQVQDYLSKPVQDKISTARSTGEDYTYYSNEYILSFQQPNLFSFASPTTLFGLFRKDRSEEFVDELFRANIKSFLQNHTENNIFNQLADNLTTDGYDYQEIGDTYQTKIELCLNYLQSKKNMDDTFIAYQTGMSFNDLMLAYQSLRDIELARLQTYTRSSRITNQLTQLTNRYVVGIEKTELARQKKADEAKIAETAMLEYDHTFTENIAIVSVNEENGLYQARPKTAYDTVTQQALNAGVTAANHTNEIKEKQRLLTEYQNAMRNTDEVSRMSTIANQMVEALKTKYEQLKQQTTLTVNEYYSYQSNNYMRTQEFQNGLFSVRNLAYIIGAFILGIALAALFCFASDWASKSLLYEKQIILKKGKAIHHA